MIKMLTWFLLAIVHGMMLSMRRISITALLSILLIFIPASQSFAQDTMSPAERGEYLSLKILTLGQGDPVYVWYGHIAFVIEDSLSDRSLMFDYGVFDFRQDDFYRNFAMGRLLYEVAASYTEPRISYAESNRRNISEVTLDVPPEKRYEVYEYLLDNIKPENKKYLYHHYYDNCSTRIRDIIDMAVDGQFSAWSEQIPSPQSYREHIRRYSGGHFFMDFLLNFLQSGVIDREITLWDEMFLPDRLERALLEFSYTDAQGKQVPIVSSQRQISSFPSREQIPEEPEAAWPTALLWGMGTAVLAAVLFYRHTRERRFGSTLYGIFTLLIGIIGGGLGTMLFVMMFFTDHDVTYGNLNIFLCSPVLLALIPLGILVIGRHRAAEIWLPRIWIVMGLSSITLLFIKLFSTIEQQNRLSIALIMPLTLIMGTAQVIELHRRRTK